MRGTGHRLAAAAGLLGAALAAVPHAFAARLPDWAAPIAEAAPALESGVSRHDSRVLFRERRIEVQPDGSWIERIRTARQILTSRGAPIAFDAFGLDERTKIRISRAWHLPPGERAERGGRSSQIEVKADDSFISDKRLRVVGIEDARPGSLVFFEFEAEVRPYILATQEVFLERGPIDLARLEVVAPPGWTVRSEWLHHAGVPPTVEGPATRWELRDLPDPRSDEPLAPAPMETAPWLAVAFEPPVGATTGPAAVPDWPALGDWFLELAAGSDEVTPEIRAAAERVTAGADSVPARIHAIGRYVRDHVRYTARVIGVGGYRPESAAKTLRELNGECKAKAALTRALLAAVGIESCAVMVNLSHAVTVAERIPLLSAFDHQIVAVPIAAAAAESFGPAVADGGELGPLAIVDPTDEYSSIGWVGAALSGRRALVAVPGRSRLVTLPGRRPEDHRVERRITVESQPGARLAIELTTRAYGAPAAAARADERAGSAERRRERERELRAEWLDAQPTRYVVEWEATDGAFVETLAWTMPIPRAAGAPRPVPVFGGTAEGLPRPSLGRREVPVSYGYPRQLSTEILARGLPASAAPPLPRPVAAPGGWSSTVQAEPEAQGVRVRWTLVLERTDYPAGAFPELKKLYGAVSTASDVAITWEP